MSGLVQGSSRDVIYKAAGPAKVDVEHGKEIKDWSASAMIYVKILATAVMITITGRFTVHCKRIKPTDHDWWLKLDTALGIKHSYQAKFNILWLLHKVRIVDDDNLPVN